jgi:hypothetical protein
MVGKQCAISPDYFYLAATTLFYFVIYYYLQVIFILTRWFLGFSGNYLAKSGKFLPSSLAFDFYAKNYHNNHFNKAEIKYLETLASFPQLTFNKRPYLERCLMRLLSLCIPRPSGRSFHGDPATHSTVIRPLIPR